jgi:hypothetical protein
MGYKLSNDVLDQMKSFAEKSLVLHRHSAAILDRRNKLVCIG